MRSRILIAALALTSLAISPAVADSSATGQFGEKITISTTTFKSAQTVVVNGSNFDETVGIYLAYCVLPKKGAAPTPCGGGVNKSGIGDASYWISSNPPPYGAGLAIAFKPGGRFTQKLEISKKIGAFDCTKVKCAITVRSDHLHEGDRAHDLFIPISFSKK
jgi:hypothetical protein